MSKGHIVGNHMLRLNYAVGAYLKRLRKLPISINDVAFKNLSINYDKYLMQETQSKKSVQLQNLAGILLKCWY